MSVFKAFSLTTAPQEARPLLEAITKKFGFLPNMFNYMAAAPLSIEAYLSTIEIANKTSFSPSEQQIILLAVSKANDCEFCLAAHHAMGIMAKANPQTLKAIVSGENIKDERLSALVSFATKVTKDRGRVGQSDLSSFLKAGFEAKQVLELMILVSVKTLSNYINNLTKPIINPELLNMISA